MAIKIGKIVEASFFLMWVCVALLWASELTYFGPGRATTLSSQAPRLYVEAETEAETQTERQRNEEKERQRERERETRDRGNERQTGRKAEGHMET